MMSSTNQINATDYLSFDSQFRFFSTKRGITDGSKRPSYTIKLTRDEDGRTVALCTNLQGVVTDGESDDEAIKNIVEAIDTILEMENDSKEYNINIQ